MYRLLLSCLALALAIILPRAAPALELTDLYSAEVPVADQRAAARTDAARAALAEVLVKVTGDAAAPTHPALQPLLKQAEQLLQSYQYREPRRQRGAVVGRELRPRGRQSAYISGRPAGVGRQSVATRGVAGGRRRQRPCIDGPRSAPGAAGGGE